MAAAHIAQDHWLDLSELLRELLAQGRISQDAAEQAMQVNFFSFVRIARAVVRPMMRARTGRIVAIGSVIGAAVVVSVAAPLRRRRRLAVGPRRH